MKKYTKEEIEKLYDNDSTQIYNILINSGVEENIALELLKHNSKEQIINTIIDILRYSQFEETEEKDFYKIPKKYREAESNNKFIKKDRKAMYKEMDKKINKKVGETLEYIYNYDSEDDYIGIHRTSVSPEIIFNEGIQMRNADLHDNVQIVKNFCFMLHELKYCEEYKNSRGCFIIKVPKKSINGNIDEALPIYYQKDDKIYLRPELIVAYVPVYNKKIGNVETNDYSHNIYDENTEFLYDERLENNNNFKRN